MNISGKAGFSRRELRVIGLLAKGATTQDLVTKLGVKKPVVLNYIHFAYKKAGVRTRPALVEWAKDRGLCKPKWLKPGVPYVRNRKMRGFFGIVRA